MKTRNEISDLEVAWRTMHKSKSTTIAVKVKVYNRLLKIKDLLETDLGKSFSLSDIIELLLDLELGGLVGS